MSPATGIRAYRAGGMVLCVGAVDAYAGQGTWGRSCILSTVEGPRAGGHGGCPSINHSYNQAEQRDSDAQPTEAPR